MPKERPIETHTEKKVTLDPELEEALASASDTELYDLAGVWQDCLFVCLLHSRVSLSVTTCCCCCQQYTDMARFGETDVYMNIPLPQMGALLLSESHKRTNSIPLIEKPKNRNSRTGFNGSVDYVG